MSLVQRQPRPLNRDTGSLRDDRLFIVACDDTYAPQQYFNFIRLMRVQVHVIPTQDGSSAARHVLDRLLKFDFEDNDERWMLLDTDHCIQGTHLAGFSAVLAEARKQGVHVALSKPSFEIWLLLHKVEETQVGALSDAKEVEQALREAIGEYNKTNLKREHYPLADVRAACGRAERLDDAVGGGEIPSGNTTRVYRLLKAIASKALPSQLPPELRGMH